MRLAEAWEIRMKKEGNQFAQIQTTRAIYDRCCIVRNLPSVLVVQFPKSKQGKRSGPATDFTIAQETIQKKDIVGTPKYYKN